MTTLQQVTDYRSAIDDLTTVAISDANRLLNVVADSNPERVRDGLVEFLPPLAEQYTVASAEISAAWYEDLRAEAVGGTFFARTVGAVEAERVTALARYAVSPLFGQSSSSVLSLLSGGLQRLVADSGRDTVSRNAAADRVRVGWQRVPRPGCCAFCAMLASRGAVYKSDVTAGLNSKYHDFDRCVVAPVFSGDTFSDEVRGQFLAVYEPVRTASGAVSTTATLAEMRSAHGLK